MKISPIDIQQQQFKTRPFGYEKTGVDRFLELLAEELERLVRENLDLMEELARVKASLKELRDREETLKETLVTTQKLTGELKSKARRDIDTMMAEAEVKAERLMHNAEARRLELIKEVQEIKRQKIDFEVNLRGLLEKHIRMLDLDAVEIARGDAEAGLLEEPLPFAGHHEQESAAQQPSADQQKSNAASQELDLEFDPGDEGDDEDGPK